MSKDFDTLMSKSRRQLAIQKLAANGVENHIDDDMRTLLEYRPFDYKCQTCKILFAQVITKKGERVCATKGGCRIKKARATMNQSDEQREARARSIANGLANKSDAKKQVANQKRSETLKRHHAQLSDEEKTERDTKRLKCWEDPEQKALILSKRAKHKVKKGNKLHPVRVLVSNDNYERSMIGYTSRFKQLTIHTLLAIIGHWQTTFCEYDLKNDVYIESQFMNQEFKTTCKTPKINGLHLDHMLTVPAKKNDFFHKVSRAFQFENDRPHYSGDVIIQTVARHYANEEKIIKRASECLMEYPEAVHLVIIWANDYHCTLHEYKDGELNQLGTTLCIGSRKKNGTLVIDNMPSKKEFKVCKDIDDDTWVHLVN